MIQERKGIIGNILARISSKGSGSEVKGVTPENWMEGTLRDSQQSEEDLEGAARAFVNAQGLYDDDLEGVAREFIDAQRG